MTKFKKVKSVQFLNRKIETYPIEKTVKKSNNQLKKISTT